VEHKVKLESAYRKNDEQPQLVCKDEVRGYLEECHFYQKYLKFKLRGS
jgi:hypothetical protein